MAGGLIQLVAIGEQDLFLISDPQISFFKLVYKRHTNFSIETIENNFYICEGFGKQARANIERIGDLISNITLYAKLGSLNPEFNKQFRDNQSIQHKPPKQKIGKNGNIVYTSCYCSKCIYDEERDKQIYGYVNSLGHALIKSVWIEIGGQRIDKQYGEWLEIWSELSLPEGKKNGYYQMIGKVDPSAFKSTTFASDMELYIPLNFWFCRNIGLALPILTLYYHDVELIIDFRKFEELWVTSKSNVSSPSKPYFKAYLLIDYVYLDATERRLFYQESQIYLIEQLQFTGDCPAVGSQVNVDFMFNHPVKELIWVLQRNDVTGPPLGNYPNSNYPIGNDWFNYTTFADRVNCSYINDTFELGVIQFNGTDRFKSRQASYFRLLQPYYYHTRVPTDNLIYVYSFALKPELVIPTGTMNFSRVINSRLSLKMFQNRFYNDYIIKVFATNFNILVITNGLGGLLFVN